MRRKQRHTGGYLTADMISMYFALSAKFTTPMIFPAFHSEIKEKLEMIISLVIFLG